MDSNSAVSEYWAGRRVLVTGATGFLGSWLTEELVGRGAGVTVLLHDDAFGTAAIDHLLGKITMIKGDVRQADDVSKAVTNQEVVFHLAAITQVLWAMSHPQETVSTNVLGTLNVLEAVRRSGTRLVFASTDKVYGEPRYLPLDEAHPLSALSPYDASKVGADQLVTAYNACYDLGATTLRWSNAYGGRDANLLRAVPDFCLSVLSKKSPVIRGDGKHIRDFTYVSDIIRAILLSAEKCETMGEAINFGNNRPISVFELASMIAKMGGAPPPTVLNRSTPGEIRTQYLAYDKAQRLLDWHPSVPLEQGLKLTLDWYSSNTRLWIPVMRKVNEAYGIKFEWSQ